MKEGPMTTGSACSLPEAAPQAPQAPHEPNTAPLPEPASRVWAARVFPVEPSPVELPALWGRPLDMALHIIEWVHRHVRKAEVDERWLRERFLRRTPAEILSEGITFGVRPCPERTVVASTALCVNDIPHTVVAHEFQSSKTEPPLLHFAIELDTDDGSYFFDFGWETMFIRGSYTVGEGPKRMIGLQRIPMPPGSGPLLLNARPLELLHLVSSKEFDVDEMIDRQVADLGRGISPRLLEERLIFNHAASMFNAEASRQGNAGR
ncbi:MULTISPECIES: hypothetical protein [Frankia]|uniref:Uncharacterized protein n=1 Tax=Frankia alni (strain DSM 45986 / CECT 9034 / ACN14a) TaxID=326424 RepID=Q0RML5_FRAAA|nr:MULTISPECIES: hypothetical protein [Frankia]CAJ61235.1 hypothetical protein; putative signal peptide [Frankia alni ACN14a]